jgi:CDP-paratose 2-epimerase
MKWLITGGCGFVGTNLANALIEDGEDVSVLDNLSRVGSRQNLEWLQQSHSNQFDFFENDVRNAEGIRNVIKDLQPDVIAHLAGQVAMTTSISNPRLDFETNALGTFNILDAIRLSSPKSIILYSSSNKVYGSLEQLRTVENESRYILPDFPEGLNELTPLKAHSPYGCSKLAADQYVQDFHRIYGVASVVFRHSSIYGSRQFATFDQGWVGWFCQKALEAQRKDTQPFSINGDGKQVRDVLHTEDLISVYRKAVQNIEITRGKVYNIGGGMSNSLSIVELFSLLEKALDVHLNYFKLDWREGDQKVFVADNSSATRDISWTPQIDKIIGIGNTVEWCRQVIGEKKAR